MLTGLNHLTLAVTDLSRSIQFYRGSLDGRLRARWAAGAYLELGDLWVCLSLDENRGTNPRADYTHYAFSIAQRDFVLLRERLLATSVEEWKDNTSEGNSFYFLDPDGHRLEVHVGCLESRLAQCRRRPYRDMEFFD
ncbi:MULTISPECIES: fosfomycin resistance glutathione transferase [unclassified Pseudomonas]|uniref:fosfomycin resistance glutathione transferase n=1 Tax=unclassified Pseudomonas TaxID=196821 RepID=UPI0009DA34CF|nr:MULTISPECIES: fosfomycin resistance glutathione transferase [unclassified Pseudomonas]MBD9516554.1 fosfomycin resistance glutathione transferase [Pseudomonas sp. PDM22]MBD9628810.1 fosfomycin resistance glutathione transferase [Pseudomonas sp. PDM19]OQR36027.1 glutathione transferase [Pseudomonas sp. T]